MPSAWRIVRAARVNSAFTGEGARIYGGRWNSRGTAVIYVSEHESLAALGIVRSSNAAPSERPIPFVSTRVGGQADRILSRQKSAAALERGTAGRFKLCKSATNGFARESPSPLQCPAC